ncbi:NUDIX domain-containing protein [Cytophagaceae bacterium ABcell3]|nr:NUDIX domain-containing protein [Cytophagaceae bacterium ABcell3]
MEDLNKEIEKVFGNKLRVRVSGICIKDDKILLIRHSSLGPKGILWAPPGGGIHYGESAKETLKREFLEETGLKVEVNEFLFVHEFMEKPLHAIELFFKVTILSGEVALGTDPEMTQNNQIINEVVFLSFEEIKKKDPLIFHHVINLCGSTEEILNLRGFIRGQSN